MDDPKDPFVVTRDDFSKMDMKKPPLLFPGVYLFLKKGKPVYIGESGDIPRRFKEHKRKKWFEEGLDFKVLWCNNSEVRLLTETIMILRERPRENRAIKIGLSKAGKLYAINFLRASHR